MMVTSGIDEKGKWVEINWIKFSCLHKLWQKNLFEIVEKLVLGSEIKILLEQLIQKHIFSVVVYWKRSRILLTRL